MEDDAGATTPLTQTADLGPSCSRGAREYQRATKAGLDIHRDVQLRPLHDVSAESDREWNRLVATEPASDLHAEPLFCSEIQLESTVWVPTISANDGVYCGLDPVVLPECETACLEYRRSPEWRDAAERVLTQLRDWKYDSISERASNHEAVFAAAFDTTAPIRRAGATEDVDRSRLLDSVSTAETDVANEIKRFSEAVLGTYDSYPVTVYRGLGFPLRAIAEKLLADPTRRTYCVDGEFSVLSNFTLDRSVALGFSDVILRLELEPDQLMSAPDLITHTVAYFHDPNEWRPVTEAEVRVDGASISAIDREQIEVGRGDGEAGNVPDAIRLIPDSIAEYDPAAAPLLGEQQHRAIREAIFSFAEFGFDRYGGLSVETANPPDSDIALERIATWLDIYDAEFRADSDIDPTTYQVEQIVETILAAAENP